MALHLIPRSLFTCRFSSAGGPSSLLPRLLCCTADRYCGLLQSTPVPAGPNLEMKLSLTLSGSLSRLDPSTVESVLIRSAAGTADRSVLLRFFVWAGLQSEYRHSAFIYSKACELLQIYRHPHSLDHLLDAYQKDGAPISAKAFKVLFNLCREANLPGQALRLLRRMGEFNCRPDTASYNSVLRLLTRNGGGGCNVDLAAQLVREMAFTGIHPDMVTYLSLMKGFGNANRFEDARGLIADMRVHGCVPNVVVYSALLDGACKSGDLGAAIKLLDEMECESSACAPNVVTYTCLIQFLCENGRVNEAVEIFNRMVRRGCFPNRVTISALLRGFCREGCIDGAFELVERVVMDHRFSSEGCYSSLVVCLLGVDNVDEAEKLVRRMLGRGVTPDGAACNLFVRRLCAKRRYLDGFAWVSRFWKEGLSLDSDAYPLLLEGLCEEGHFGKAVTVVEGMVERGIRMASTCFDGLVEVLNRSGETDLALQIMASRGPQTR